MNVVFTPTAWEQYTDWQKEDKKIVKRINDLIKSIDCDGLLEGIGKPEPLKHGELRQSIRGFESFYIKMAICE